MIKGAERLKQFEEYFFSKKLKEIELLKENGRPIINLGIGSPDLEPPLRVVNALKESLVHSGAHGYKPYRGILELRKAISDFYNNQFGVALSPLNEVLPLMGSKEGVSHISMAFLNPGDQVLIPNPGYPTYGSAAKMVGAEPVNYNLNEENSWMPNLVELEQQDLSKVKLMWVNYPHMPTGANATNVFFENLIAFAKRNDILIVNDNPYAFILNDNPKSILKYPKAKEVCIELNSLSKTFNMAGWRVGMVLGAERYLDLILKVKSNLDSGMFYPVQKGAIAALESSKMWYYSLNSVYESRRLLLWEIAELLGLEFDKDGSGLFVWAKLPIGKSDKSFVEEVLTKYNVFFTPGSVFGSNGLGYIRMSLCAAEADILEVIRRIKSKS
ncbi:MAG: aminotransferase [Bacteroidetes bacterium MedPE-SWsnd-G2]|nr:MAG: aminotransferase [Bacteroidetes bacterium MedPE-SWsnd-G2]